MKFAHLSDCHIGGWREPKLKELGLLSFSKAVEECIKKQVDFILISGDLFDTPIPQIEVIKSVAEILSSVKKFGIRVYIIPGSHDFSASGKTMISVFEKAGIVKNVMQIHNNVLELTADQSGAKLTGVFGRIGGLETEDYKKIDFSKVSIEKGFKIFLFHTLLTELKPAQFEMIETPSISILPKGFDYYAGGHPHFTYAKHHQGYGIIAYPGPTFPNNFKELEELHYGSFFIVTVKEGKLDVDTIKIKIKDVLSYNFNIEGMTPKEAEELIMGRVSDYLDKIVLLRIHGRLKIGSQVDINFKRINEFMSSAYVILKNTSKLYGADFEELIVEQVSPDNIEIDIVTEFIKESKLMKKEVVNEIINVLNKDKEDGETNTDFSKRIIDDFVKTIGVDL